MINNLPSRDAFFAYLNTPFHINEAGQSVELLLTQVSEINATREARTFSILLHGPADCFLSQRIYTFSHSQLGEFDLFLVPVSKDAGIFVYQAIFNQLMA